MTISELQLGIRNWRFTKERAINFAIGFGSLLIYEFAARPFYRPYIYRNNINDFHLADTIGNSLGTIATVFVLVGFIGKGKEQHFFLIKVITFSVVLYELAHPLLGKPIDPWDIIATVLSGGICFVLYRMAHRVI